MKYHLIRCCDSIPSLTLWDLRTPGKPRNGACRAQRAGELINVHYSAGRPRARGEVQQDVPRLDPARGVARVEGLMYTYHNKIAPVKGVARIEWVGCPTSRIA
jgi:hypothetical protein